MNKVLITKKDEEMWVAIDPKTNLVLSKSSNLKKLYRKFQDKLDKIIFFKLPKSKVNYVPNHR